MKTKPSDKIYLGESNIPDAGRGVFAADTIDKDEVVEVCPVLVLPTKDYALAKQTILRDYYFMWGKKTSAICLGYGSFYNHSYEPNTTYKKNLADKTIEFVALKKIKKNEEITVNYNYGDPDDKSELWIEDIEPYKDEK
ncbi:MAG TPA: SET domain-containing protein [Bacteroidales bacterium]|nr:SET domain-containing protein [Bacteroidales bacterium]